MSAASLSGSTLINCRIFGHDDGAGAFIVEIYADPKRFVALIATPPMLLALTVDAPNWLCPFIDIDRSSGMWNSENPTFYHIRFSRKNNKISTIVQPIRFIQKQKKTPAAKKEGNKQKKKCEYTMKISLPTFTAC